MGLQSKRSESGGLCLDLEFTASPNMLSEVRRAIADLPLAPPVLDVVLLLANELVTNSIRHAGLAPHDRIQVKAEIARGRLRMDVIDGGRVDATARVAGGIRPTPGPESGWGLYLVDSLATRWGHGSGRYWFELDLDRSNVAVGF
jgi:anti-sigma regulatory factor (Ser/Thr protein kinase)